jgi:choline-sulfatase
MRVPRGLLVLALLGGMLAGCEAGGRRSGDILLLTVDTLRADHTGPYGYARSTTPRLAAYFEEGRIFERSYATSSYTSASVVSVLSGLLPQDHRVRLFDQLVPETTRIVTDLLPEAYQAAAFVSNAVLSDDALGIAARFDHFDDEVEFREGTPQLDRNAADTTDAVVAWLRSSRDPSRPLFLWVHYMDPHLPYSPPEAWKPRFDREREGASAPPVVVKGKVGEKRRDPVQQFDDYDREIAYVDAEIGRLLDAYAALADPDEALVIFTSDHGETLAERSMKFQHAYHVFEELVRVPLLIRGPGVEAGRSAALVSGLDLLPTMLAFAGAPLPPGLSGMDLRDPRLAERGATVYTESAHGFRHRQWRAAIRGNAKWLVQVKQGPSRIAARHFLDLAVDPDETGYGPWRAEGDVPRSLLELVERDPDPAGQPESYRQGTLEAKQRDALRALGYVQDPPYGGQ